MSLRQQWNLLLKFGCNAEETSETTQQKLCCNSSAALDMIKRKGSTRKTRHIELKAFFLQLWSARPEVRLVQVWTSEVLAECLIKIVSTPNMIQIRAWSKRSSGGGCRTCTQIFDNFVFFFFLFFFPFSVARITHSAMNSELTFLSTQFVCALQFVVRYMSNCGQTPAVPEPDWETYLDSGAEDKSQTSRSLRRCSHVPSLSTQNMFSVHATVETAQNTDPNCANADNLTRNFRGSGGGKNPHLIRRSGPLVKSFM